MIKMEDKLMLEMTGISKSFGARRALKNVSLTLGRGEALSVIGPSGSGKSTLLRIAALLERADSGALSHVGQTAACDTPAGSCYAEKKTLRACNATFGMVFQSFELFPHMSVADNIADAPVHVKKQSRAEAYGRAEALLEKVGLAGRGASYPFELSGGEKQRVCIARALAMEPSMLFFDEPTSALDPGSTRSILDTMRALAASGMTMLVVTHEMRFAREVSSRVLFLQNGEAVCEGPSAMLDCPENERLAAFLTGGV